MWVVFKSSVRCYHSVEVGRYHTQTEMNGNSILANNATKGFTGQIVVFCHWLVDWSGQVIVHAVPISFTLFQEMRSCVTAYSFHKTLNSPVKRKKEQLYKSRGTTGSVAVAQSPDLSLTEM